MKDRVAKSVFWMAWSRGAVQLVSLVSTLAVARLLAPGDYGLFALAAIWINTISLVAELGMGAAIVQFPDLEPRELNTSFWLNLAVAVAGYAALFAVAPRIEAWFAAPRLATVIRVLALALPIVAMRVVPENLLRKDLRLDKISQAEIVASLSTLPVVLGLAASGFGVWALVASGLIPHVTQGFVCFRLVSWRPGIEVGSRRLREILHYSLATLGSRLLWSVLEQADSFVLGKVSGQAALGVYSMAKQLAILPVTKISVMASQLSSVVMARQQSDRQAMRGSFRRALRMVACLTIPVCLGIALLADDTVRVVLGPKWLEAAPLLRLMAIFAIVRSLDGLMPPVLMARYRTTALMAWTMVVLAVMPVAFWVGSRELGPRGVAFAWLLVYPGLVAWLVRAALRELDLSWAEAAAEIRLPVLAAIAMAIAIALVQLGISGFDTTERIARIVVSAAAGAALYGLVIFLHGANLRSEIAEIARWLWRPKVAGA